MSQNDTLTVKTALTDITVALAAVATVGEGMLAVLPSGPLTAALQIGLPVVVAVVAQLRRLGG